MICSGLKSEEEKKDVRKKAEEYLSRAEELKRIVKSQEGILIYCTIAYDMQCTVNADSFN